MIPGEYLLAEDLITCNRDYGSVSVKVKNIGDRAVQVGSHFHFFEANETGLVFDRQKAYGKKLDIPSGTAIRFEPGQEKEVRLVDFGGRRRVFGFNNRVDGSLQASSGTEVKA